MATEKNTGKNEFPIVGIGASAGGLAALEGFFDIIVDNSDMAFVIIQHLDPTHKSLLGELLQKYTEMAIVEIRDGIQTEANCIYLAPADKNVGMLHGVFQLFDPPTSHSLNLPIDCFFRSLAEDMGRRAICVILSGTGADGSLGLKAVKGAGGLVLVQSEQQAEYSGMPHSAIETGLADLVLPVEQMPIELQRYVQHPYFERHNSSEALGGQFDNHLQKIFVLLRATIGHDFSRYKDTTIRRRIERRMAVHRLDSLPDYLAFLHENPTEVQQLFKDLLIGVTNFFRDPEAFSALKNALLQTILSDRAAGTAIRIWVTGCSTGEEAYSLAMLLIECAEELKTQFEIQIFASDLDSRAIEVARNATYPESISSDVPPERLRRFFSREDGVYKVKKQIRELVVFAEQNLIKDPPFSKLDLLSCRNLLIYLKPELQKRLLPLFHYTLNPQGLLFLGTSESIGDFHELFAPLDQKCKIFQRQELLMEKAGDYPMVPFFDTHPIVRKTETPEAPPKIDIHSLVQKIVIEDYAPPCVLIDRQQHILYFFGHCDRYLKAPTGEPVFDIVSMTRQGLKQKLRSALRETKEHHKPVRCEGVRVKQNGNFRSVDLVVRPLREPAFPAGTTLLVFYERPELDRPQRESGQTSATKENDQQIEALEMELQNTKESLQTTIEELETSNEELKSTNEELQSVNEELQSSNEELKTSKEELQSTNEELTTVNAELQHKVDELSRANNDINNLLASTEIGTIFLDVDLNIKRFTPVMRKLFNLIGSDIDRPIGDITSRLEYTTLAEDAKSVLDTLMRKELEIQDSEGRWYSMRIAPYRTVDNIIDGVVVTFVDMTELYRLKVREQDARKLAESIVQTVRQPLLVLDSALKVLSANSAFYRVFHVKQEETEGKGIYELGNRQWDIPKLRELLEKIVPRDSSFDGYEVTHDFPGIGRRTMLLNAHRIEQTSRKPHLILLALEDVTEKEDG